MHGREALHVLFVSASSITRTVASRKNIVAHCLKKHYYVKKEEIAIWDQHQRDGRGVVQIHYFVDGRVALREQRATWSYTTCVRTKEAECYRISLRVWDRCERCASRMIVGGWTLCGEGLVAWTRA